ncbi:hypothetical protein KY341_06065, partial [Candidatus Woesearchaeota archaeon]|nr:hypothetical protein [Candidatus Woesearchaeota archaeon]
EYKDKLRAEKIKTLTEMLIKNAADANTGAPLTATRISNAFREANVHVDIFKRAEDQLDDVVSKLRLVLPLTFEKKILDIRIPANNAARLYGFVNSQSKILDQAWLSDGSWSCKAEIAAGMIAGFLDELKSKTHGDVEVSVEKKVEEKKKK